MAALSPQLAQVAQQVQVRMTSGLWRTPLQT